MALNTVSGFSPALLVSTSASASPLMLAATQIWLASFVKPPAPTSPHNTADAPVASNIGAARSNAAWVPPTMMASVPAIAPGSPPDTGASRKSMPASASSLPIFCETSGAMELMSTTSCPLSAASIIPFSPSATVVDCGEFWTITTVISDLEATSAGDVPRTAPSVTSSSTGSGKRSYTTTS